MRIGMFDSGLGGLSVFREVVKILPECEIIYVADQAHVPYGSRTLAEVRNLSLAISQFLLEYEVDLIVVACNTASAASLNTLRQIYPETHFVGMEPAVKPAAQHSPKGIIGILATPATFQGELYNSTVSRYGQNITIYQDTCPGLVEEIEAGLLPDTRARSILEKSLLPMLANGVDTIVLGCTHYPFAVPIIREIVGAEIQIIDPAPAVARQVKRVLMSHVITDKHGDLKKGIHLVFTTRADIKFNSRLSFFIESGNVRTGVLAWVGDKLQIVSQES